MDGRRTGRMSRLSERRILVCRANCHTRLTVSTPLCLAHRASLSSAVRVCSPGGGRVWPLAGYWSYRLAAACGMHR